jgi:hypothetical protein
MIASMSNTPASRIAIRLWIGCLGLPIICSWWLLLAAWLEFSGLHLLAVIS